eukprot:CAMPEP_0204011480 /NCGR_PEP_ID=MMETSP0360-20130528/23308_1 /ASSEMBLY_ACC=CAM_ASM_000342 /TAXON_ID=268821 /ORGANISM="Scrippsiella Hangoei, Strain SHTV-5" /LENGTH=70 /DNA_ID=CAMNT_0050954059 /DNA_START=19 /DNA_END=228 /DNA_ORIENTATION=-
MASGIPAVHPCGCLGCTTACTGHAKDPSDSICIPHQCSIECSCNPGDVGCTAAAVATSAAATRQVPGKTM